MNTFINAKANHKPLGAVWLVIAGQVGIDAKGKL